MDAAPMATSLLYKKTLGCLLGGIIGDAMGTPSEGKDYQDIEREFGWIEDFSSDGTDDTVMKDLLTEALVRTSGYATLDDWAAVWLDHWNAIFGSKVAKFYISVLHTAHKLRRYALPRLAALGNMPSSSSAMCISPVGIANACNPRLAALQAYSLASLIHVHDVGFCQDGAAAMAAGVAEAMRRDASVLSILTAAQAAIIPASGQEMRQRITHALDLARSLANYTAFRRDVYAGSASFFCTIGCDARETVPLALALFALANGDVAKTVTYGANFGRDADTIASMAGALAGALGGADSIPPLWVQRIRTFASTDQDDLAEKLVRVAIAKNAQETAAARLFQNICVA